VKFKIKTKEGIIEEVRGRKFSHYINNKQYWFFYSNEMRSCYDISEIRSGFRVDHIDVNSILAHRGNIKEAAKSVLDKLIEKHGALRVEEVIKEAIQKAEGTL
jgi:hypothetical protein